MMLIYLLFLIAVINFNASSQRIQPDLSVIGSMKFADGLDRLSISFMDCLYKEIDLNFIPSSGVVFSEVPIHIREIVKKPKSLYKNSSGKVALFLANPTHIFNHAIKNLPNSQIKLAYSMLESTRIPNSWVKIFNDKFDAVIVPDKWLVKVYKKCGVEKPIFVLPHSIYLEEFLNYKKEIRKPNSEKPFIFGCSAVFCDNKNQELLIRAFNSTFGNNRNVRLILHGRRGNIQPLNNLVKELQATNITIFKKILTQHQYLKLMSTFDCYVLISKGEGFSVTPREALALGTPCILSNNTAHKTICNTGFVRPIKSNIRENAYYVKFERNVGHNFNCTLIDTSAALSDVYNNYNKYLEKAALGKDWVRKYLPENLKSKFLALISPKEVKYSKYNEIEDKVILTNDNNLLNKYQNI